MLLIILVIENVLVTSRGLFKFDILVCGLPIFVTIFGTIELNPLDYRLDGMQVQLRTYAFIVSHIHCLYEVLLPRHVEIEGVGLWVLVPSLLG